MSLLLDSLSVTEPTPLQEICPRPGCGQRMAEIHQEQNIIHRCTCGYESKTVTGESKLAFYEAIGRFYITRSFR